MYLLNKLLGDSLARGPKLLSIKNYVIEIMTWKFIYTYQQRWKTAWTPSAIYWTHPVTCICLCSAFPHLGRCESNAVWVKMYTFEKRVFLVHKYWHTGSFKACQMAFERNLVKDMHHRSVASRNWLKFRDNGKPSHTTCRRPQNVWRNNTRCKGAITGVTIKITTKTFPRD